MSWKYCIIHTPFKNKLAYEDYKTNSDFTLQIDILETPAGGGTRCAHAHSE
jgi:hypothetical protein